MRFAGNIFRFFIFSNLFIAFCAVLMVWQSYYLLLHGTPDYYFTGFVFFATLCSYSFHWLLTPDIKIDSPRLNWLRKNRLVHRIFFIIGLAGVCITGFYLKAYWYWLLLSAVVTFLYSAPKLPHPWFKALRKVAIGKTIFLAFVWMYVTTLLPLLINNHLWQASFTFFALSRFFLIYAICILFDYRDKEYDRSIGIKSLITWLSYKNITRLFYLSLLLFLLFTAEMILFSYSPAAILVLLLPGIVTAILYRYASTHFSDMLFYFVLDGLMALSAILMLLYTVIFAL